MKSSLDIGFERLLKYSKKLEDIDYNVITKLIMETIRKMPVTTAILNKGSYIDRVRPNEGEKLFYSEDQISYIQDKNVVDNFMNNYGRCNLPHQVIFYGALESSVIKQQRVTAISETSRIFRDAESIKIEGELLTLSRWEIIEDIIVAELVFHDEAIQKNPDTLKSFDHHLPMILESDNREEMLKLMKLFSYEFAKTVLSHEDFNYKISAAYTNLIINDGKLLDGKNIEGITYPSVVSGFQGQNVVLHPDVVNKKLRLKNVTTHRLHKNKLKSFINNDKMVTNFGENNCNFTWKDADCQFVVPIDKVINEYLK